MNKHQHRARKAKYDEYYTLYSDVAAELMRHKNRLKGQRIHCPFSDYRTSEVVRFLTDYFWVLGLSHLTATCLDRGDGAWRYDYDGRTVTITRLSGNGSFDSAEVTAIMRSSNVVIDNPPFSKWGAIIKWTKAG